MIRDAVGGLIMAVLLASPLEGQEAGLVTEPLPLTAEEAVERAVSLSEEVRTAEAEWGVTASQVTQARSAWLPQISAALSYDRALASIFDGLDASIPGDDDEGLTALPFGRPNTWSGALQISQPVYTGGRVSANVNRARSTEAAAELRIEEARADIALQVREAYFQAVLSREMVRIAQESYELADAQLKQVELFREQGTASEFDVLSAQVERDNLQPGIVQAQTSERVAELNLKRLTNIPADQPIELVTPLEPEIADVDRAALREALARRPELRALDETIEARESGVRLKRAERLPEVGLAGTFSYQAFPEDISPFGTDWRRDWSVGVQASIPVFTGFRNRGEIHQAEAELELAELEWEETRQSLELELNSALGDFDAASAQVEARRATVGEAERAVELAELRFANGLATQLELSNVRLQLQEARTNEAQALFDYVDALARLERLSGGQIPLVGPRLPMSGRERDR